MQIISRYLLAEFALSSAGVFFALFVTWLLADSLLHLDLVTKGAFGQILFRALEMIPLTLPFACLAGVVWSLTRAVRFREITAIRCGGIPLRTVLIPILVLCTGVAGGLILFEDRVIVPLRGKIMASEADEDTSHRPHYLSGRWWYSSGSSIFSAAEYKPDQSRLLDVTVFEFGEDRNIQRRIDAASAVNLDGSSWEFHDANVRVFNRGGGLAQTKLAAFTLDLGLSGQDMARASRPVEITTLHKLARRIREHREQDETWTELQVAFHGRLAKPLAVLVLVLLAVPFAIGDVERGDSLPKAMLFSLVAGFIYYSVWALALPTAASGFVPPPFPLWGCAILFLMLGLWRFRAIKE